MDQQNYKTMELTDLPFDMILYMANFLDFEDYTHFVQSLGPNYTENVTIQRKLWQIYTHKIKTNFINGKEVEIEYNFDPWRPKEERVLLNWDSLLTVFIGAERPPMYDQFVCFPKLKSFICCHMHMDQCSNLQHASCHCHKVNSDSNHPVMRARPSASECKYKHFHHFCYRHLGYWFEFFLKNSILHREKGEFFDEETGKQFMHILGNTVCF